MSAMSNYLENKLIDHTFRGVAYTAPGTVYIALFIATAGQSPRSTAVTTGQTTVPAAPNGHMYKCTTGGTTGSGEPTWPTTIGGTVTDGTAVWTEMSADFDSNSAALTATEPTTGAYARVAQATTTTNFAATNGATTTTNPSSGTSGTTSNNAAIPFTTFTANLGFVGGVGIYDASSAGNLMAGGGTSNVQLANSGTAYSFAISALSFQIDN